MSRRESPSSASAEQDRIRQVYGSYERGGYSAKWSDRIAGNARMATEVEAKLRSALGKTSILVMDEPRILDLGCGTGGSLSIVGSLMPGEPRAVGCDVLEEELRDATSRLPGTRFAAANGLLLPFRPQTFDLITMFTVLSSVPDDGLAIALTSEARRVLKPGGVIVVYDFRYPSPTNRFVRPLSRRRLRTVFHQSDIHVRTLTLLPPLARAIGGRPAAVYAALAAVPLLRSHLLAVISERQPHVLGARS